MEGPSGEGEAPRQRRGPAPIASFDHDGSDESSPESKLAFRLPEIREHPAGTASGALGANDWLSTPAEGRARSHSTPAVGALPAPTPRIDISRASSSSHHDSRDSSPELALFAGDTSDAKSQRLELGFREDGALDLRSSTEELSFMEPAPGERPVLNPPIPAPEPPSIAPPPVPPPDRRHSRKDSQSSEAALLGVSGRTSRLSSVGSACSAQSAISRVSRLSVVSGVSRSPSPHRMLLETSFCGPKPIETDPEACAAAVAEHILEIAKMSSARVVSPPTSPPEPLQLAPVMAVDARDHREVRTEVTVEAARPAAPTPNAMARRETRQPALALSPVMTTPKAPEPEKTEKETKKARNEERKARPRVRREPSEPEVYKSRNKSKDIIRIKLRPDDEEEEEEEETARKPASLELTSNSNSVHGPPSPAPSRRRSPSPLGPPTVSRKSSFCSLFKSRETIGSPDSPQGQDALRRKRSLTEGRSRSKSRDRSATPTSTKIRGSVLSLFRTQRKSIASSSPGSRATSPAPQPQHVTTTTVPVGQQDKLKYYEDTKNGIIHIPLRTPPEDRGSGRRNSGAEAGPSGVIPSVAVSVASSEVSRPASAPQARDSKPTATPATVPTRKPPVVRTVLPDGSIIIPLHSPTERASEPVFPEPKDPTPPEPTRPVSRRDDIETVPSRVESVATSLSSTSMDAVVACEPRVKYPTPTATPVSSPPEQPQPSVTSKRRKEKLVFTTHVGSREQVFSTQFSITKTPSVTSEISGSFPSFDNGELRDTHITSDPTPVAELPVAGGSGSGSMTAASGSGAVTPQDPPRDSSGSEPSSEAAAPQAGNDVERRGLVVQESFEDELPYVPTTLPQERSVAVPMIPVRDRGGVLVQGVQRPRATVTTSTRAPPPTPPAPVPIPTDKLKIKLPRRPRVSSASSAPRPTKERTRSGGDSGSESRTKQEWIDFEEVPERRKQPKRIQTLPVGAADSSAVVFSYVEPEHCRCECHAHAPADDQLPLLQDDMQNSRISTSSAECGEEEAGGAPRPPFTTDLDLRDPAHTEPQSSDPRP